MCIFFFFQAEDGIRDVERSRGLGDVCKRRMLDDFSSIFAGVKCRWFLYTSDAADDLTRVERWWVAWLKHQIHI